MLMSFGRYEEILSDGSCIEGKERPGSHLQASRRNEFPVGYSLAACFPAEPASASPTACQCLRSNSARFSRAEPGEQFALSPVPPVVPLDRDES